MQTIQAKVNTRLLSKADRLFTGTLDGRIIEILQNARRAGATEVNITNEEGTVTVCDNGHGIDDFSALLDLGKSDWNEAMDDAEDPAGVGIFCLAPRRLEIRSSSKKVVITEKGWTGEPVPVQKTDAQIPGTMLIFQDEPWEMDTVELHAVFCGLEVVVDGKQCASEPFVSEHAVLHPKMGCKIEVRQCSGLSQWHDRWRHSFYSEDALVNFHGQVISLKYSPLSERLRFLVEFTGEPTGIRLMLPARTQLVENDAFEQLKAAMEKEAYRYIQSQGKHRLHFKEYRRAHELGIELPEAEPVFDVGLLSGDSPEPIEVAMPKDFPLAKCYRLAGNYDGACETDDSNTHLLAAIGKFKEPFVPITISRCYDGYRWADLPTIDKVEVTAGKELASQGICNELLIAVDSLNIAVHTTDGKVFKSDVCMAVLEHPVKKRTWCCMNIHITLGARSELNSTDIWYHCGGWNDEGDTWDTQLYDFEQELEQFWATIVGPAAFLRSKLLEAVRSFQLQWQSITIDANGALSITHTDGSVESLPQFATAGE